MENFFFQCVYTVYMYMCYFEAPTSTHRVTTLQERVLTKTFSSRLMCALMHNTHTHNCLGAHVCVHGAWYSTLEMHMYIHATTFTTIITVCSRENTEYTNHACTCSYSACTVQVITCARNSSAIHVQYVYYHIHGVNQCSARSIQ